MMVLIASIGNILINIVIYAVLFNIIYRVMFSGIKHPKILSVALYTILMLIKIVITQINYFILHGISAIPQFLIATAVYVVLGFTIVIILDRIANYKSKRYFVVLAIVMAFVAEVLLARILFVAINAIIGILIFLNWLIMFIVKTWVKVTFNLNWF